MSSSALTRRVLGTRPFMIIVTGGVRCYRYDSRDLPRGFLPLIMSTPSPVPQPYLHDLVTTLCAPTVVVSGADGQVGSGADGLFRHDRRLLAHLVVDVDGQAPVPVGHDGPDPRTARFTGVVRHLGDPSADPTVWLERHRRVHATGMDEHLTLVNASRQQVTATVRVTAGVDFATMDQVKQGIRAGQPVAAQLASTGRVRWTSGSAHVTVTASAGARRRLDDEHRLWLEWRVTVGPRDRWAGSLSVTADDPSAAGWLPVTRGDWHGTRPVVTGGPSALAPLMDRGLADLDALLLADSAAPGDAFAAAGSPWYLTLFGRDSLWTARFTLPLGTALAAGTLRALARHQGRRHDPRTAEAPGRIPHEVRCRPQALAGGQLVYFGTIDATALWVCLLHDAWRWGMPSDQVAALLDPMTAALRWLVEEADQDGDGFVEYLDQSGHGLANQGWKDSTDSIQFRDGRIADPPIALSEAQAYAYQAAIGGAALLEAFGRPGADRLRRWAARLRERFAESYWVGDARGGFPAIALDGDKRPVDVASSNLGHLLATGLLTPAGAAVVAARMSQPDLAGGYGLRTMSADAVGFNPLSYHAGSVWPHDTAIAVQALSHDGHGQSARALADGLLQAAPHFDYRLPELYAGTDRRSGQPLLPYPAACRPQAWSAVVAVPLLQAALGLHADVPGGTLVVRPRTAFASWFPMQVDGLQVAGEPLRVMVDGDGTVEVDTRAPVRVEVDLPQPSVPQARPAPEDSPAQP